MVELELYGRIRLKDADSTIWFGVFQTEEGCRAGG
ncbi:hypothetical protein [Bradyrhizobium sp. KBS0727]